MAKWHVGFFGLVHNAQKTQSNFGVKNKNSQKIPFKTASK
jgi:hypothetical protein